MFTGKFNKSTEELDAQDDAEITLTNTSANRSFVAADKTVRVKYDGNVISTWLLGASTYKKTVIKCGLLVDCYERMKKKTITGTYTNTAADTVLAAICAAAGVTAGSCPSTAISVRFDKADCFNAAKFVAESLNTNFSASGTTFTIAARGSLKTLTYYRVRENSIDRFKTRDKVIIRGVDTSGLIIYGEAGTGSDVAVFVEKKATDEATLDTLAEKKLDELNTDAKGFQVEAPINEGCNLYPGDTVAITNALYNLSGTYPIKKVTKSSTKVAVDFEKPRKTLADLLLDVRKYADLGIYSIEPDQLTPQSLNLQGLQGLYHLNEGEGAVAKNSAPDAAEDGAITNGFWVQGPLFKYLNFDATGYVDCGDGFDVGGLEECAVGIACSPEEAFANANYLVAKLDQVVLQLYGLENKLRFAVRIGGSYRTITADIGSVELFGRLVAFGVYTGSMLQLYVNGKLVKEQAQAGAIDASAYNTFIGSSNGTDYFFHGPVGEAMLWRRKLSAQEVQELYFFPLARVMKKGVTGWICTVNVSNDQHGTTNPSGVTVLSSGEDLVAEAFETNGAVFLWWRYDGVDQYSTDNPITIPAEDVGTHHSLLAMFTPPVGVGVPILAQVMAIVDTEIVSPVVAAVATVVDIAVGVARWFIDCAYSVKGTFSPAGLQVVASGATLPVSATPNTAFGYVVPTADPFKLDGVNCGTVAGDGQSASYTVPAQTDNTWHQIVMQFILGWGIVATGMTANGYFGLTSGNPSQSFTAAGSAGAGKHWHIWLDGTTDLGHSPKAAPAQTDGTYHSIAPVATDN